MKNLFTSLCVAVITVLSLSVVQAQNNEELSLKISKAEDANLEKLKAYLWKRKSETFVDGQSKGVIFAEMSFDATGKMQVKVVGATSSVQQKPGLRGAAQKNAIDSKMDYIGKALELSLQYTYMTKGQLLDFFSKATVSKKEDGTLVAVADNIYVQGDRLTVHIDPATSLFKYKEFKSLLGKDPIDGQVNFEKFTSGVSHVSTTLMNLPAQKMKINATNQDYSQRVN